MIRVLAVALVLVACGPPPTTDEGRNTVSTGPDLTGTYSGSAVFVTSCADGSGASQNLNLTWTVTDNGDSATIDPHGTCGLFSATGSGGSLVIQGKTCPDALDSNGNTVHTSLHTGDLSQDSGGIAVSAEFYESGSISCTSTGNARLTKQ